MWQYDGKSYEMKGAQTWERGWAELRNANSILVGLGVEMRRSKWWY